MQYALVIEFLKKYWSQILLGFGFIISIVLIVRWYRIWKNNKLIGDITKIDPNLIPKLDKIVDVFELLANNDEDAILTTVLSTVFGSTITGYFSDDYDDSVFEAINYLAISRDAELAYVNNKCIKKYGKSLWVLFNSSDAVYAFSLKAGDLMERLKKLYKNS